jgi:hypothetical protein
MPTQKGTTVPASSYRFTRRGRPRAGRRAGRGALVTARVTGRVE